MTTKRRLETEAASTLRPQTQKWVESLNLFPYQKLRPFQTAFLKSITKNRRVIAQAPTGAGKTIVALSALLPSVDAERGISLIIFTRTKSQVFDAHLRELANLSDARVSKGGRIIRVVPLISKGDLCISPERKKLGRRFICSSKTCNAFKQAKFFEESRYSELYRLFIQKAKGMTPERMVEFLQPYGCPYQLVRGLCQQADVIITTHAYLVSEGLRRHLKSLIFRSSWIGKFALIDEVHNLSHRITTTLSRSTLEKARQIRPEFRVFRQLLDLIDLSPEGMVNPPTTLDVAPLYVFCDQNIAVSNATSLAPLFDVSDFLETEGDIWISDRRKLIKLDPFPAKTFAALDEFAKVVVQSGTLYPLGSY
ncbi:MAG: DEAD/DEAH box helicase, partial [Candidatus Hodarchaeales archaeon]